jgi:hypothetical protein
MDAYLELSDRDLLRQCEVTMFRASGPGGQKRNKTDSAVRLKHKPTGVMASASDSRLQQHNRTEALVRLRWRLAADVRRPVELEHYAVPLPLRAFLPAQAGNRPGRRSAPYALAMQHLLDLFVTLDCSVSATAQRLGITTANAARLLLDSDWMARAVNRQREARGLRRLR